MNPSFTSGTGNFARFLDPIFPCDEARLPRSGPLSVKAMHCRRKHAGNPLALISTP